MVEVGDGLTVVVAPERGGVVAGGAVTVGIRLVGGAGTVEADVGGKVMEGAAVDTGSTEAGPAVVSLTAGAVVVLSEGAANTRHEPPAPDEPAQIANAIRQMPTARPARASAGFRWTC